MLIKSVESILQKVISMSDDSQTVEATSKRQKPKAVACIRCGVCLHVCPHNLSPVFIKEALEKQDIAKLQRLRADLCVGCGNCTYVCPSRIDLRASVLRAKASLR